MLWEVLHKAEEAHTEREYTKQEKKIKHIDCSPQNYTVCKFKVERRRLKVTRIQAINSHSAFLPLLCSP